MELKMIQEVIENYHKELNVSWFHRSQGEPLIVIEQKMFDSFLDDIPVRILCHETTNRSIVCSFMTQQRQVIHEMTVRDSNDLDNVIDFIKVMDYVSCRGISEESLAKSELRKCKLEKIFLEKYGSQVILRSRKCSFICRGGNSLTELCQECQNFQRTLESSPKGNTEKTADIENSTKMQPSPIENTDDHSSEGKQQSNSKANQEEISAPAKEVAAPTKRRRGRPTVDIYSCRISQCPLKFSNLISVKRHLKTDHPQTYRCNWQQSSCSRTFATQEQLTLHLRRHSGDLPFYCNQCNKGFLRERELKVHKKTHSGVKPFPCHVCEKKFGRSDQLKVHMSVHSDAKGFLCVTCGTSFTRQSHLIDHNKRAHVGEKRYKCDDCNKTFFAPQQLKRHKRIHTGERPYQCPVCGKKFSRSHHLVVHTKRLHGDVQELKSNQTPGTGSKAVLDGALRLPIVTQDGNTITIEAIPGPPAIAHQITVTALDTIVDQVPAGVVAAKTAATYFSDSKIKHLQ